MRKTDLGVQSAFTTKLNFRKASAVFKIVCNRKISVAPSVDYAFVTFARNPERENTRAPSAVDVYYSGWPVAI